MKVVLAPDKFKGCLTAAEVAAAVGRGIGAVRPDVELVLAPVADGGDGTVAAALSAGFTEVVVDAVGPTGEPVRAPYAVRGDRAVVELAAVAGLDRLPGGVLAPLDASTYGLGLVVAAALDRGATEIVLGLGGSASTDGGAGLVQALGARLLDAAGHDLPPGGAALADLAGADLAPLRTRFAGVRVLVATDVDSPLLGPTGAAAVFGPQKGASPADVATLDAALAHWARVVAAALGPSTSSGNVLPPNSEHTIPTSTPDTIPTSPPDPLPEPVEGRPALRASTASAEINTPGAGAAGGTGFAALALLGAQIRPGIEVVLELVDFAARVEGADLVVTGEGSLDEQSLAGKAPVGVARAAAGAPVVAVCGRNQLSPDRLRAAGLRTAYPLSDREPDLTASIAHARTLLDAVGRQIAKEWLA